MQCWKVDTDTSPSRNSYLSGLDWAIKISFRHRSISMSLADILLIKKILSVPWFLHVNPTPIVPSLEAFTSTSLTLQGTPPGKNSVSALLISLTDTTHINKIAATKCRNWNKKLRMRGYGIFSFLKHMATWVRVWPIWNMLHLQKLWAVYYGLLKFLTVVPQIRVIWKF